MRKMMFLAMLVLILLGCANKPKVDLSRFPFATDDIQNYAESHISTDWFTSMEPVKKFAIIGLEITKVQVLKDDDHSANMTVVMKGYYVPMSSTSDDDKKNFKLTKIFQIVPLPTDSSHYEVSLVEIKTE